MFVVQGVPKVTAIKSGSRDMYGHVARRTALEQARLLEELSAPRHFLASYAAWAPQVWYGLYLSAENRESCREIRVFREQVPKFA